MISTPASPRLLPDVFVRMRRRLTLQYSGLLMLFLGLFIVVVYGLLHAWIWNGQHGSLRGLADREAGILQHWIDEEQYPKRLPPKTVEDAFAISADQSFYYLFMDGELRFGDELQPELRPQALALIGDNSALRNTDKVIGANLATFDEPASIGQERAVSNEQTEFLVTGRRLTWQGEVIGELYVGKQVSEQHRLLRDLLRFLVVLAGAFFVLALWLSHYLSLRAIRQAALSYERQRQFAADASHELRTPLAVLQTSLDALQMEERIADPELSFVRRTIEGMRTEVSSMTKMIAGLLSLARAETIAKGLPDESFGVSNAAEAAVQPLRAMARDKRIDLSVDAPDGWMVRGDKERLKQLIVLLADNALKYTPEQGRVRISLSEAAHRRSRRIVLKVQDNGVGIAPEDLPRIFDRFYRQDQARQRAIAGHGLGLAIARSLVDAAGGTIRIDSKIGAGTTFEVRLPIS